MTRKNFTQAMSNYIDLVELTFQEGRAYEEFMRLEEAIVRDYVEGRFDTDGYELYCNGSASDYIADCLGRKETFDIDKFDALMMTAILNKITSKKLIDFK